MFVPKYWRNFVDLNMYNFLLIMKKSMKFFKLMMLALVAMVGLNSCSDDCNHDFIEHDFTQDIVGTWTFLNGEQAEAMVIKADGSFTTTGIMKGGALYEEKGTIKVVNNKVTLAFDGDKEAYEGRLELVAGKSLSLVMFDDNDVRLTYDYCENDLSDEILGMWVCNETPSAEENDMLIMTYNADGTTSFSGYFYEVDDFGANKEASYKVIGDLLIHKQPDIALEMGLVQYTAMKIKYTPNGTALGDIMSLNAYAKVGEKYVETTTSWLRIKQHLELPGMKYDYIKTFVTNVKGEDKDIPFLNTSFNFAKMDGSIIDKFLKSILFTVEFPDANTINYNFLLEGQNMPMTAPIVVEGNKMTIKMSATNPVFHDVVVYTFQDKDNTQMHMYMPTSSFEKFFANTSVAVMLGYGQLDPSDANAVAGVYKNVADAVHSINLSLVMSKTK